MTFDLDHCLQVLERTPRVLRSSLEGLDDAWIHATEGPETWSPFDVVGHLIDGEESDWIVRTKHILEHGPSRAFEPFDRFKHLERNRGATLGRLLDEFARLREQRLRELSALELTAAEFELGGLHPALGEVKLSELLATWVVHDLGHTAQVQRVMAKRWTSEVGPWAAYLPILKDGDR